MSNHLEALTNFMVHGGGLSVSGAVTIRVHIVRGDVVGRPISESGIDARILELQPLVDRGLLMGVKVFSQFIKERLLPLP